MAEALIGLGLVALAVALGWWTGGSHQRLKNRQRGRRG